MLSNSFVVLLFGAILSVPLQVIAAEDSQGETKAYQAEIKAERAKPEKPKDHQAKKSHRSPPKNIDNIEHIDEMNDINS